MASPSYEMNNGDWEIAPIQNMDKRLIVNGPLDIRLFLDFDDVDRVLVMKFAHKLVDLLNRQFPEEHINNMAGVY